MPKSKPRSLITGITGFAGSHMAELLLKEGHEVFGITRHRSPSEHITNIKDQIVLEDADLLDLQSLQRVMMSARPHFIFHLAAQSFVPASWSAPAATLDVNVK